MSESSQGKKPEQVVWESYLKVCEAAGKKPTVSDFTAYAKDLLRRL
ncbi:MAG: hypothetical protein K6T78_06955 [Alicyclobacillus sp.]|nr:hypothetical protein [Alicyclobacillus sp.]